MAAMAMLLPWRRHLYHATPSPWPVDLGAVDPHCPDAAELRLHQTMLTLMLASERCLVLILGTGHGTYHHYCYVPCVVGGKR